MEYKDIIIIGGGASGIACAIKAKEKYKNKKVTILEAQSKIARKLMSTGNGRCNFTNINACKNNYHGSFKKYVDVVLSKYSPNNIIDIFNSYGIESKIESEGRAYPYSNHASSVVDSLINKLNNLGVEIVCDCKVSNVKKLKGKFIIDGEDFSFCCNKLVVTTGSQAGLVGGSDLGYTILQNLGHKCSSLSPALCPINVKSNVLASIKGIRSTGKVSLIANNKIIREEIGEIQFTEKALSGICVFNLATYINNDDYTIRVNLLPSYTNEQINKMISNRLNIFKNNSVEEIFTGLFHKKLGLALLKECNIKSLSKKVKDLNRSEISRLSNILTKWNFKVTGLESYKKAQVVAGGVYGNEINPETMESNLINNLYICGEAVDINGDCGGYNLQFAFASGMLAGDNL